MHGDYRKPRYSPGSKVSEPGLVSRAHSDQQQGLYKWIWADFHISGNRVDQDFAISARFWTVDTNLQLQFLPTMTPRTVILGVYKPEIPKAVYQEQWGVTGSDEKTQILRV